MALVIPEPVRHYLVSDTKHKNEEEYQYRYEAMG
jgi:hypothetical protein